MSLEHALLERQSANKTPTVIALELLWKRITSRPLWLPPHFWRYVRLSRRVELRPLTREDVTISVPLPIAPSCRVCTETCCIGKKNTVPLRLIDIATLIDLGRTDLIATEHPSFAASEQTAARQRFTESRSFSLFPVLRQDEKERCVALGSDGRCSLYPDWPLACARFPYALDLEAREIFYSPRCGSYLKASDFSAPRIRMMVDATLAAYNHRLRDWILLDYAPAELAALGLTRFLSP